MDCPSSTPSKGSLLFAVKTGTTIDFLEQPVALKEELSLQDIDELIPDSTLRFSNKCIEGGCLHFDASHEKCGLAERLMKVTTVQSQHGSANFQKCGISKTCRWHAEHSLKACAICESITRKIN